MHFQRSKADAISSEQSIMALLIIDVINDFAFPEGSKLLRYALPAARRIVGLKRRAVAKEVPSFI
jgi:nicotinamidase-related amidase